MSYTSINPYTGKVVATYPTATDAEVEAALTAAHAAFIDWSRKSFSERADLMRKVAALFGERQEDLARIQTEEMGMAFSLSKATAGPFVTEMLHYYADNAEQLLAPTPLPTRPHVGEAYLLRQPMGIIYAIEPWNSPYYQAIRPTATNLMAGNVVILKHASNVPGCAEAVAQIMRDAGVPEGVFTNIRANHAQSERIIEDRRVRGVTLTGSSAAGARVGAQAGAALKPAVLELGGSDASVILDDADLELATSCSLFRYANGGQICASPKRMIVMDGVYDEFVAVFTEKSNMQVIGDPMDPATTLGPLSSNAAAEEVRSQIRRAVAGGATAVEVGPAIPSQGAFVQPTILTGISRDNPVFHEEIFGPVSMIFRAGSDEEVVDIANDSIYGLAGSVFSGDVERAKRIAGQLDTGSVTINQLASVPAELPFGGTKDSGYGKEMGPAGILEFTLAKVVNVAPQQG